MNSRTVALITGASRGIGRAVFDSLAAAGWVVVGLSRSLEDSRSSTKHTRRCDITDAAATATVLQELIADVGLPNLVVLNAGKFTLGDFDATSVDDFRSELEVNVTGSFVVLRSLLPLLKGKGAGHVVTIGSVADNQVFPGNAAYAASKHALRALHEVARQECTGSGVRFTLISPGATDTALWDPHQPDAREDLPSRADMMKPQDVASAVVYVAELPARANVSVLRMG